MNKSELQTGFHQAKVITKKFAKSFYFASLFLPKNKRQASYAVYAICRLSDEAVDDLTLTNQENSLQKLEEKIAYAYTQMPLNQPLLLAFHQTVTDYKIPKIYFEALIQGMQMDLNIKRYPNFSTLKDYCYKAAGVVGLMMLDIFGYQDPGAEDYALNLGIAMQLTNILRDISEDLTRDRVYLPQDELLRFGIPLEQLVKHQVNLAFKDFMRFQIQRNRKLYVYSLKGIKLINNPTGRFVASAMNNIYSEILNKIEKNKYDVFKKRATVGIGKKIIIIIKLLLQRSWR